MLPQSVVNFSNFKARLRLCSPREDQQFALSTAWTKDGAEGIRHRDAPVGRVSSSPWLPPAEM